MLVGNQRLAETTQVNQGMPVRGLLRVNGQVSALVEHLFDIDVTKFQR
jgi:hypothetical protein